MSTNAETTSVDAALDRMQQAWARGDASAYAAEFTDNASYVIYVGVTYEGSEEIERALVPVFERHQRGSRMRMNVLHRASPVPGLEIVVTEGDVGTGRGKPDKIQTFTMVRTDEGWRCAAFQVTKKNSLFLRMNTFTGARATKKAQTSA